MASQLLTILGSICFAVRLLFFFHNMEQIVRGKTGWWIINFLSALLALTTSTIALVSFDMGDNPDACEPVDGAFGGLGTRVGLWITVGFILLQWFIGAWTSVHIGSKAMAAGLIVGNVAIFLCLILQQLVGQLSFTDKVIGSMVIDVQGNTLLNQLAMKETLVSVWMVTVILVVGFASLIEKGILVGTARHGPFQPCKLFFFDSIYTGGPVPTMFWLYYITRWLAYITTAIRAIRCLLDFYYYPETPEIKADSASLESQDAASFSETQSLSLKRVAERRRMFLRYHGTVEYFGAENFVFAVCVIFNFERTVELVGHDTLDSFGQEMGLIVALVSVISAVFGALRAAEIPKWFWEGSIWGLKARSQVATEMELGKAKDESSGQVDVMTEIKNTPGTSSTMESNIESASTTSSWISEAVEPECDRAVSEVRFA